MIPRWGASARGPLPTGLGPLLFVALAAGGLGVVAAPGPLLGIVVAVGGLLLAAAVAARPGAIARDLSALPLLAALALLAAWAPLALATELLAGAGGLAVLLWLAAGPEKRGGAADASGVLVFPMLAVAIGALATALFTTPPAFLEGAAALLVGGLLLAGWLFRHPGELAGAAVPS
ncbi:MAG: hypothetical protein ACYDFT_03195 [Thermoplasmata archaeon]